VSLSPVLPVFPSLWRARYAEAVLTLIAFFTSMDVYIGKLVIEPMKHDLGLSDVQAGVVNVTAIYAAYAVFAVPAGILADRFSRVRLLLAAAALWCLGQVLVGLSHVLWSLVAGKLVIGVAQALTYPAAMSLFSDFFAPERRATATITYPIGQTLGGAGAVLIGGVGLAALTALVKRSPDSLLGITPWRAVSLLFGLVSLVLIPLLLAMREPARQETARARAGGTLRELIAYRGFLLPLFIGMMFLSGVSSGVFIWVMPALTRLYGQEPGDYAAWLSIVTLAAGLVGVVLSGWLIQSELRRGGMRALLIPAAVGALVSGFCSFIAVTPNVPCFAVVMTLGLVGSAVAISVPVISINFRIPNELRGLTMGLYVVLISVSGGLTAPLVGWVSAVLGGERMLGWAMALVGFPFGVAAAVCFWTASRAPVDAAVSSAHPKEVSAEGGAPVPP
jgi:MFS family permease